MNDTSQAEPQNDERLVSRCCFNSLRDRAKRARPFSEMEASESSLQNIADESINPAVIAERNELKDAVWKAINSLKDDDREIILLRDFQEMSYKEIAATLDCPLGTVMSRLFNARKQLREQLEGYLE